MGKVRLGNLTDTAGRGQEEWGVTANGFLFQVIKCSGLSGDCCTIL